MARPALAPGVVRALRRKIAAVEGRLAEDLDGEPGLVRLHGRPALRSTGVARLDAALGGGLPQGSLVEVHGRETRDSGAVLGFALALAALLFGHASLPLLWIGTADVLREAGHPYAPGLLQELGWEMDEILFAEGGGLLDALWIAEEAAALKTLAAVILELRGSPARLDLDATRRLHRRAQASGRPLFLLRQAGAPQPTAAPLRFVAAPAPAAFRQTVAGPLPRSIGPPVFDVSLSKSRALAAQRFLLEWNADERAFRDRTPVAEPKPDRGHGRTANPRALLSLSRA